MKRDPLAECTGFDWDEGNLDKNWEAHGVAFWECEEVFLNRPLVVRPDERHSRAERRYYALGRSEAGRLLFVAFTIRRRLVRPISFRDMTAKERAPMSSTRKKIPKFSSESEEREFWGKGDSTEYIDWSKRTQVTLPKLRPTLRTISIRLPESMIAELKRLANKRDVPYQSLLKVFLAERIECELAHTRVSSRRQ